MIAQQEVSLFHPMPLWDAPRCDAAIVGVVWADTAITFLHLDQGFYFVSAGNGQQGYLPAAALHPWAVPADDTLHTIQPVWMYRQPVPGEQYRGGDLESSWLVFPTDTFTLLGTVLPFHFVQLESGRLGFFPTRLCSKGDLRNTIRFELVLLGFAWGMGQILPWLIVFWQNIIFFVSCVFVLILVLWMIGCPRAAARSFAIGLCLSIGFTGMLYGAVDWEHLF